MKFWKRRLALAVGICAASAGLAWVAGFNFDELGFWVALWCGNTILLAAWAVCFPWSDV